MTRNGHCIQCDTQKIAHQLLSSKTGFVYIAGSKRAQLVKLGSCGNLVKRIESLRQSRYAQADDWCLLRRARAPEMGKVEIAAKSHLKSWSVSIEYEKQGRLQVGKEAFACGFPEASQALDSALVGVQLTPDADGAAVEAKDYEFPQRPALPF